MSRSLRSVLAGAAAFTLLAIAYTSALIVERQRAVTDVSRYNLTWSISQASLEVSRFEAAVGAYGVDARGVDGDAVQLRYDIVVNRVGLLRTGEVGEFIRRSAELSFIAEQLARAVATAGPIVNAIDRPGAPRRIIELFAHIDAKLAALAAAAYSDGSDLAASDLKGLSRLHWIFSGILAAVLSCSAGLIVLLVRNNRLLRASYGEVNTLLVDLRHSGAELVEANRRISDAMESLRAAKEAAEAANRAKSDFLTVMSHELRTPLNGVIGMTGLLLDCEMDEQPRHYTETLRNAGEHLMQLINDVLDFTRLEANHLDFEQIPFDIHSLVQSVLDILAPRAHAKGIELGAYVAREVPATLVGDPGRLRQILVNLVGNGVKFTDKGSVSVEIEVAARGDQRVELALEVRDTGPGIAAENLPLLFREFTQLDSSISRRFGGSGLGLAISRRLAIGMQGSITVESTLGTGSVFRFTVPLGVGEEGSLERQPADLSGMRVLVVDDNSVNLSILLRQIRNHGGVAAGAMDAAEAFQLLCAAAGAGASFDAAVIDRAMPVHDGVELGKRIRAEPSLAHMRLVLATSWSVDVVARRTLLDIFDALLTKPMPIDALTRALDGTVPSSRQVIDATPATPEFRTAQPATPDAEAGVKSPVRVLVAEDNQTNQLLVRVTLEKLGYRVDLVGDGLEAVEAVMHRPYDLVLMDVMMPEMDGIDATRRIRRLPSAVARIPIIGLTAHASPDTHKELYDAGMDGVLTKPITGKLLAAALSKVIAAAAIGAT